jgi:ABC-2 type transport system permease protein
VTTVAEYRASKELFTNLTLRELRSKYKRSFLGWTWSLATPLANMVVYTIVFAYFLKIPPKNFTGHPSGLQVYALYLLCGMLPWNYFQISVTSSIGSLVNNSSLIKKTYFPRTLLPGSVVGAGLVSHLIEMSLLLVALLAFGNWRALAFLPFVFLLTAIMMVFALGLGLMLSALNIYFRDIEHFAGILFLVWMYMTPIIYPISVIHSQKLQDLLKLNPMTDAVAAYRAVLYDGRLPGALGLSYFAIWAIATMVAGLMVFSRLEAGIAEEL